MDDEQQTEFTHGSLVAKVNVPVPVPVTPTITVRLTVEAAKFVAAVLGPTCNQDLVEFLIGQGADREAAFIKTVSNEVPYSLYWVLEEALGSIGQRVAD